MTVGFEEEFEELNRMLPLQEINKDPEQEYAEAKTVLAKTLRLMENEDYKWLIAVMQKNLDSRVENVFKGVTSLDNAIANLFSQAEIRGFQAAMLFLSSLKNGAEASIKMNEPYITKKDD